MWRICLFYLRCFGIGTVRSLALLEVAVAWRAKPRSIVGSCSFGKQVTHYEQLEYCSLEVQVLLHAEPTNTDKQTHIDIDVELEQMFELMGQDIVGKLTSVFGLCKVHIHTETAATSQLRAIVTLLVQSASRPQDGAPN